MRRNFRAASFIFLLVIFFTLFSLIVSPALAATITVDGDLSDWAGVTTFADSPTDAGGGSGGITAVWMTADGTNLYARWDETLTANRNLIKSEGFKLEISNNGSGSINANVYVLFNSSGVATTEVEFPLGTFTTIVASQQSCNFSTCSNGSFAAVEASVPLSSFTPGPGPAGKIV